MRPTAIRLLRLPLSACAPRGALSLSRAGVPYLPVTPTFQTASVRRLTGIGSSLPGMNDVKRDSPEGKSVQDTLKTLGVGEQMVIQAQAGPGDSTAWSGHVHLAVGGGAKAVTLVFKPAPDSSAEAPVWADAPEGKDHIKQWHADLVESLLEVLIPYLPSTAFRIVGLESLGAEESFVVGWLEQTIQKWCQINAEDELAALQEKPENKGRDVYALPESRKIITEASAPLNNLLFVTSDAYEGRVPAEQKDGHEHKHEHEHSHNCGPSCNH